MGHPRRYEHLNSHEMTGLDQRDAIVEAGMAERIIVHVSADFPDPLAPAKTQSVLKLISETPGFRHVVYSLNRVSWTSRISSLDFGPDRKAIAYGAPPRGLWLATCLERVADYILADLRSRQLPVDMLHLHKFTIEGLVGLKIARTLKRPFIVNIWGDTDSKVVKTRRDLKDQWSAIAKEASVILPHAPWTEDLFHKMVALDRSKSIIIPAIVQNETYSESPVIAEPRFVTLFNLDSYKRKNLVAVVNAIVKLSRRYPGIKLDVYGRCSPPTLIALDKLIDSAGARQCVSLKGPLPGDRFSEILGRYVAFLMPSRRETFGMVFIEALFAGLPLLYSKGWGIDGYFKPGEIGYACDAADPGDIERGIERLLKDQAALKGRIAGLHQTGAFERFKRREIAATYRAVLDGVLNSRPSDPAESPASAPVESFGPSLVES